MHIPTFIEAEALAAAQAAIDTDMRAVGLGPAGAALEQEFQGVIA